MEKQKVMQNDAKLQNSLKLYDLAEKLLVTQEQEGFSENNVKQLRSTVRELHQILKNDVSLAKEIEKRRGADLTIGGTYTGKSLEALIYWANFDEMSAEVDKFTKESVDIAEMLAPTVTVGKQKKVMEMKMKREAETENAMERLKRQQIKESARFGVGLSEKETEGKLTFRSFFNSGGLVHKHIEDDLRIRVERGDEIAKSALIKAEQRTEVASLNRRYYLGKLDVAFAALNCTDVRNQMYQDMEIIFSTPKNEIGSAKYQKAIENVSGAIETKINEIIEQMGVKQKAWEERRQVLYKNIERGGIVPLELIDKSKQEIEEFFSDRVKNKTQRAESLTYLVFAKHALEMLSSENVRQG